MEVRRSINPSGKVSSRQLVQARTGSLHWMTFGLACCAVEMMHAAAACK